jgi:threonine dehydrogenase-like Zn-dependent dehydrogenase
MKAALLLTPRKIEIREIAQPEPAEGEVLIQPIRVGICGSDVSFYLGHRPAPYPFVLGHELVGRVAAVAKGVTKLAAGQRVIVEPNYPCGNCAFCRSGRGTICPNKRSMGVNVPGCLADYVAAPAEFVWALPDSISDLDAATIEPLTVSLHAVLKSGAAIGDTVAVVGCGVVGLLLIHVAVRQGIRVLAHDKIESKLEWAQRLGAIPSRAEDVVKLWHSENVTTVFECAGVTPTVELALGSAPRGALVMLLGLSSSPAAFVPLRLVREGIRIEPSLIYDHPADFARAIALVAGGTLHPSCVVTDSLPFDSVGRALEMASSGQAGKIHAVIV